MVGHNDIAMEDIAFPVVEKKSILYNFPNIGSFKNATTVSCIYPPVTLYENVMIVFFLYLLAPGVRVCFHPFLFVCFQFLDFRLWD